MKVALSTMLLTIVLLVAASGTGQAQFKERGLYIGPNVTLATDPIGFGAQLEYGITPNIGLGGMLRYWGQSFGGGSWTLIIPQAVAYYHFLPGSEWDPFLGARLGYASISYSWDSGYSGASTSSGVFLNAAGGVRYFFTPRLSIQGTGEFRLAGEEYFSNALGLVVGLDFTL